MKRQVIVWILLLAVGLQGSVVAFAAGAASMPPDDQSTVGIHSPVSHMPCCPTGSHTMTCCLDGCLAVMAIPVTPPTLAWYGRPVRVPPMPATSFSSRGDSPLIRPPIL